MKKELLQRKLTDKQRKAIEMKYETRKTIRV